MEQYLLHQTMRWYGPQDLVKLSDIRQSGCEGVVTALHEVQVGEVWPVEAIEERKNMIEAAGMRWTVIESLPVSEDIKRQSGNWRQHIENYKTSLHHIASCGLKVVAYNFMPVLDWLRTDISYTLPNGSKALYFEKDAFVAFDLFILKRPGADKDYDAALTQRASDWYNNASEADKEKVSKSCLLGLPGSDEAFTTDEILALLDGYRGIDTDQLRAHLVYFLQEIIPVAEALGLKMAIHPDDPPQPVLGLPRIVSTAADLATIIEAVPSPANGLCFCTGSLGARADNDIPAMVESFGDHIHFFHMRNTRRDEQGNFYEADHLTGNTNMYEVMKKAFELQQRRNESIPMRPDHGHQMLDDLNKNTYPGYTAIGRLKGLAELRGLEYGILMNNQ